MLAKVYLSVIGWTGAAGTALISDHVSAFYGADRKQARAVARIVWGWVVSGYVPASIRGA